MNSYRDYNIVHAAVDRASAAMAEMRQAERDVAAHTGGMAFDADSAAEIYRKALDHCGVSRREIAGLSASALRVILKNLPLSGAGGVVTSYSASMAMDAAEGSSALSEILDGIPVPRDISIPSDRRR
jgi:hypothetical protein